jgi:acetyltransferase-like isoleucine patch superfamily enzyme
MTLTTYRNIAFAYLLYVFTYLASCAAIAKLVREQKELMKSSGGSTPRSFKDYEESKSFELTPKGGSRVDESSAGHLKSHGSEMSEFNFSQSRLLPESPGCCVMFLQSIPLMVLFPFYTLLQYILLLGTLLVLLSNEWRAGQELLMLAAALFLFNIVMSTVSPLLFILIKWTVIGRYRTGRYPVFGSYYLRWWFVDVCRKFFGKGMFASSDWSLNLYYRLLGAKIGRGAKISPSAEIAEYDLVTVGDSVALDDCVFRGFAVDNGCMILGPVGIGNNSSVGTKSIVAPHTFLSDCIHLGPQMSSYDVAHEKCIQPSNAQYNRMTFKQPNLIFTLIGKFIVTLVQLVGQIPTLMLWYMLITADWRQDQKFDSIGHAFQWLCDPHRIPLYLGIRYSRKLVEPIVYMLVAIGVKRTLIGKFQPGPRCSSQYQLLRYWLAAELFQKDRIQSMTDLIGRHFELVSCMYRLLGASVGNRVFWPGTHIEFDGLYDLLEIGDDAVFGSRTTIMSATSSRLEKVRLCAGANVADNCVVLPGATIGKNAVLGAYGLCPADWYLPESSVWFGSRAGEPVVLEKGVGDQPIDSTDTFNSSNSVEKHEKPFFGDGDESTLRPFGKAYYNRDASYFVMPLPLILFITLAINLVICTVHAAPLICSIHLSGALLYGVSFSDRDYLIDYNYPTAFIVLFTFYCIVHSLRVMVWAAVEIGSKWLLMGQREAGVYNWDTSSYNQRWEILQLLQKIRNMTGNTVQDFITGSPFLTLLFRLQGCKIGKDCCLWPTGGDPFPSEIDLLTIGDRCVIDDGRLVCHLNTRGNFELTPIILENDVTLRRMTKIQKGALLEFGAMVLEHSLVMTGETVEANSVWQGSPAVCVWVNEESLLSRNCHEDLQSHYSSIV